MGFGQVVEGPHAPDPPNHWGVHGIGRISLLGDDHVVPRIREVGSSGPQVVEDEPQRAGVDREHGVGGERTRNRGEAESRCSRRSHGHTLPFATHWILRICWCSVVGWSLEIPPLNLSAEVVIGRAKCPEFAAEVGDHRISFGPVGHRGWCGFSFHGAPFVEHWS